MKRMLAILISGLILLSVPMLATAHDSDRYDDGSRHSKGWVKDRHDTDGNGHKQQHKWEKRQAKKHYKQHLREHRRDRRHHARYYRPYYAKPAVVKPSVVVGFPRLVFHIDW